MIVGIGSDIIKIERVRRIFDKEGDPFIKKTYTEQEREEAMRRNDPAVYYASRFAGKEAVFKSLGIDGASARLNEIEILHCETGQPVVTLKIFLNEFAEKKGIRNIMVTLSYEDDYAIAFAVAEG